MLKLDWAEPGEVLTPDYESVRAWPLKRPPRYEPLTREVELDLVRRWHVERDRAALRQLVGAHRPMVVSMAETRETARDHDAGVDFKSDCRANELQSSHGHPDQLVTLPLITL
jgi:hypothetical protein